MESTGRLLQPGTPPAIHDNWATAQQDRLGGGFGGAASPTALLDSANDIPTDPNQAAKDLAPGAGFCLSIIFHHASEVTG